MRQYAELYPLVTGAVSAAADFHRQILKQNLIDAALKLLNSSEDLKILVDTFLVSKNPEDLQQICSALFANLPIETGGVYHPMLPTQQQLNAYLSDEMQNMGDCKLLTIICAYICNVMANIPSLLSVRSYNGHPILYLNLPAGAYKISFRYNGPTVKPYRGENPFDLTAEDEYQPGFTDKDFKVGEEQSTLYWDILNAVYVLDCLNVLRRSVVNLVLNPTFYLAEFTGAIQYLKTSGIYAEPVIDYWETEMDRVSDLLRDPRSSKDKQEFRLGVISSLRFTE